MRRSARSDLRSAEEGAVALIVAVSMTALLVIVGMVVDFGLVRTDKLTNKAGADSASAAGIRALDTGDGEAHPWAGVCAALSYLSVDEPTQLAGISGSYKTGAGSPVLTPCAAGSAFQAAVCVPSTPATWAWYTGTVSSGNRRLTVDIKSGYTTPDPTYVPGSTSQRMFPEDYASSSSDNGVGTQGGCDQLAVIVTQTRTPGFGSIANGADLVTRVRSVARTTQGTTSEAAVAMLMLERTTCGVIAMNSAAAAVLVKGNGAVPGSIHADSNGSGAGCSASNPVIKAGKPANIIAEASVNTPKVAGVITTVAGTGVAPAVAANASDGLNNTCAKTVTGTCAAATGRTLIGREPADDRYLGTSTTGVKGALTKAEPAFLLTTQAAAQAAGYTWVNSCSPSSTAIIVFVNCPLGANGGGAFPNATTVVFNGPVSGSMTFPKVQYLYIKGTAGVSTALSGSLSMGMGASASCSARAMVAPAQVRAQLVIRNGGIDGQGANFHFCSTTVIMAESWNAAPITSPAASVNCPIPAVKPILGTPGNAPYTNACKSTITVASNGTYDWTAPNLVPGVARQTDWNNLEDLALWTEAASSSMGGGGGLTVSGVFFLPNAVVDISGGSDSSNPLNAQFISRSLGLSGNGSLTMRPSTNDAVTIPLPPSFGLVR